MVVSLVYKNFPHRQMHHSYTRIAGLGMSALGLGCVETFVHLSPEIFVTEPAGKLGIRRFGAQNRFYGWERAL